MSSDLNVYNVCVYDDVLQRPSSIGPLGIPQLVVHVQRLKAYWSSKQGFLKMESVKLSLPTHICYAFLAQNECTLAR